MYPAINIGPLVLPTSAFLYLTGAWLCLWVAERSARELELDPQIIANMVVTGLVAGVIAARLTFVALYWPAYQNNLLGIVWPINSGFAPWSGLLLGAAAMFFYGRYKRLSLAPTLDALAPVLVAGLMVVSLADFLGGPGFGTPTDLPWGIGQFGIRRHPVQLYELLVGLLALIVWISMRKKPAFPGQLFLATTAVYAFGRLFTDAFRADAWITAGGWHVVQLWCFVVTMSALILLARHSSSVRTFAG